MIMANRNRISRLLMAAAVLALPLLSVAPAMAETNAGKAWLKVSPGRCVALRQGQICHQALSFSWGLPQSGEFCLRRAGNAEPEVCWTNSERTSYKMRFESVASSEFALVERGSNTVLDKVVVEVAWVYKSSRSRSGWRIF